MIAAFLSLAALTATVPATAAPASPAKEATAPATAQGAASAKATKSTKAKARSRTGKTGTKAATKAAAPMTLPPAAERVREWVSASGDHHGLPYAIIDKNAAAMFLFDAKGNALGSGPVLIGIAPGDDATPGVGSKNLAEIGPAEKTTPAGRYLARFGVAAGNQRVLWVDYATSVALHPIPGNNPKEKRRQRMLSPTSDDNRITFGCINVPKALYSGKLVPQFTRKGGYVYILPDTKPIEQVFPALYARPATEAPVPAAKAEELTAATR